MQGAVKTETSTPLPQRPQKNQGGNAGGNAIKNKQEGVDGPPAEKKPRPNPGAQNGNAASGGGNQNQKNFGGNNNRGFGNRNNNRGGNRGGNAGGGNRGNFQNNQQNQNQQNQQNRNDAKPAFDGPNNAVKKADDEKPQLPQPQQQPNLQQQQQHQQNSQMQNNQQQNHMMNQNRGGGGGGDRHDRGGDRHDRSGDRGNRGNRGGMGGGDRGRDGGDRGNRGGGGNFQNMGRGGGDEFFITQRLRAISGPTHELPPIEINAEQKFSGRCRLYVGNLTNDVNENELRDIFKPFGEIGEVFHNPEKNFAFLKMDYYANAEKAKRELDGSMRKGRSLRVRFAPNSTILRVKNLPSVVSNELLYTAFEVFGPVERAHVNVDDRGKPTGEGIVEFNKKQSANACLRMCNERCFFLTSSLRPCVVETLEQTEDADGLPEKALNKKTPEFNQLRSVGPRFADVNSFEHEYGSRWKQLLELFKNKQEALKTELRMEEEKLEAQMEYARYEHETEMLRQELRKREQDNERKKIEWEMREKQAEELLKRQEENMQRQQTEMQSRMLRQEEEMRRRQQENTLFMQAQQLNSLLDQQEGFGNAGGNFDNFGGANNSPFDFRGNMGGGNNGPPNNQQNQDPFAFEFGGNNQNQGGPGNPRGGGGGVGGNNNNGNNGGNQNNPWERRRRF